MTCFNNKSIFSTYTWINDLLARRDLRKPDQRPLFAYQLTAEEYVELRRRLSCHSVEEIASDKVLSAAFCLFCAEWYRREYVRSDGWTWDPIWKNLGIEISANHLQHIVPKGLENFWQRPIRSYDASERRNFLGSLFSEGGLPFQVLQEPGSRFQQLFDRLLKRYAIAKAMSSSLKPLVEKLVEQLHFPQVFKEETSLSLIADMAEQLVWLVNVHQLDQQSQPVDILDQARPAWRDSFPLPLDDVTGREFLNALLQQASNEVAPRARTGTHLSCEHFLVAESSTIDSRLSFPNELSFSISKPPASNRFDLSIYEGRGLITSLGPGYAELKEDCIRIKTRLKQVNIKRRDPSKTLFVIASIGGRAIASREIPGSRLDIGDSVVGFDRLDDSDHWPFVGQGSFSTKTQRLLLLTAENAQLASTDCSVNGSVVAVAGAKAWDIAGAGKVSCQQEDVFSVKLGSLVSQASVVELCGRWAPYITRPINTFLGVPRLQIEAGASETAGSLQMYLNGKQADTCKLNEKLGIQRVTVKSATGDTWLRRTIGILPSDFSIEIKPGVRPNIGIVVFRSGVNCFYDFDIEGVKVSKRTISAGVEYELVAEDDIPPANFNVRVWPNLESEPIDIRLPFPSVGVVALDQDERPLRRELATDELLGSRLYLFAYPDRSIQYAVELTLQGQLGQRVNHRWQYQALPNQPVEISLYELKDTVESLLSLESGIDRQVCLRISGHGSDVEYRIQRHAIDLDYDQSRQVFYSKRLIVGEQQIKPILILLSEPERRATEMSSRLSEGVPTGEFNEPEQVNKNGPWLVLPSKSSSVSFRPRYLPGTHTAPVPSDNINSLQRAVLAFDHCASESAFSGVLKQMAQDPSHSGWQFLKSLYDQYNYLSLATFEVWKALVEYPEALIMSLCKFDYEPEYMRHLERDFPLIWEVLPISIIKTVSGCYWNWMIEQGTPVEVIDTHLKPSFGAKLSACMPMLGSDALRWIEEGVFPQEIHLPESMMHEMIGGRQNDTSWYQGLLRSHGNTDSWPTDFGKQLKHWYQGLDVDVLGFEPEQSFRNAVVYLPVFLAAVAAGKEQFKALFLKKAEATFYIRQIRDFDIDWFKSVYQYALLKFIAFSPKELTAK